MELKYFVPAVEDLHIGYECEMIQKNGQWGPFVFDKQSIAQFAHLLKLPVSFNTGRFRTPYLTMEQILNLGWKKHIGKGRAYKGENDEVTVDLLEDCILISQNQMVSFCGQCKDINTFKFLCKLLRIV